MAGFQVTTEDLAKQEPTTKIIKIPIGRTAVLADLDKSGVPASLDQIVQMLNKVEGFDLRDGAAPELRLSVPVPVGRIDNPRIGYDFRSAFEPLVTTEFEQDFGNSRKIAGERTSRRRALRSREMVSGKKSSCP